MAGETAKVDPMHQFTIEPMFGSQGWEIAGFNISFTNWSTGHNLTHQEAVAAIQENSLTPPADGATYTMTPARRDGDLVLLLVDETTGKAYAGSKDGLTPLAPADVTIENASMTPASVEPCLPNFRNSSPSRPSS